MGHKKLVITDPADRYPSFLKELKRGDKASPLADIPTTIVMGDSTAQAKLERLVKSHPSLDIIDNYDEQYAELLLSKNAHLYRANHDVQVASIKKLLITHYGKKDPWTLGAWVFYPWRNELVHILAQDDFEALRTIRNRDLITETEQKKLFDFRSVSFGMSVGSAGALAMGVTGISRKMKLVDGAVISGSNLNRIVTGVSSVGVSKSVVIGRQIYEMNPYSTISYFDKATSSNIKEIFDKPWPIDIAIDEIDDIE